MTQQGQTGEGKAENNGGRLKAGVNDWLPLARIFIMARSLDCSTPRGRRYVCSPSPLRPHTIALRRLQMPRRYGRVKAKPPSAVRFAQP